MTTCSPSGRLPAIRSSGVSTGNAGSSAIGCVRQRPTPSPPPGGAGRDGHMVEAVATRPRRHRACCRRQLDVAQPLQLRLAVVEHPDPRGQARQPRLARHPPAQLAAGLGQHHLVAAAAEHHRRFQPGRPGAHHQHPRLALAGADPLRVPAAPPLLAHARVLGAADRRDREVARTRRCCSRCTRGCPRSGPPPASPAGTGRRSRAARRRSSRARLADHPHHRVRRGEAADADHRLRGQRLQPAHVGLLAALLLEPRGDRVVGPDPSMKSQQSGSSPTSPSTSSISARSSPRAPIISSTAMRQTTPARRPPPSVSSITSRSSRARFSMLPPYSSVRWL